MVKRVEPEMLQNLLRLAEAFRAATGKPTLQAVSRLAHGDSRIFDKIFNGEGSITIVKYDDAIAYLTEPSNWPAGSVIPQIIDPQHHQEKFHGTKTKAKRSRRKRGESCKAEKVSSKKSNVKARTKVGRRAAQA